MTIREALKLESQIWNGDLMAPEIADEDLARLSDLGWRWSAIAEALPEAKIIDPKEVRFLLRLHKLATEAEEVDAE